MRVTYPFGHGLSYTTFDYSDLRLTIEESGIRASVAVTNTGPVAGREVVQFYTSLRASAVQRPPRELKGFGTIDLEPGATGRVETLIRFTDLAYWETRVDAWKIEGGDYTVEAGASSRDIRISGPVTVAGTGPKVPFSRDSTLGEVMTDPAAAAVFGPALQAMAPSDIGDVLGMDLAKMMESFPINRLGMLSAGGTDLDALLADLNAQP
jgi:beta-glucosidase